ncbi:hypothetical protein HYG87_00520 [Methanobacterium alkalithermotolerans]|uniref:Uncharacterized protein n=1 Tax=Methanobacterium alkalithermotolerans TaxID=2731220 RepID=A0A8T8K5F7_9EURY|nr:hypothetical protein [Methanobacterium alkalithermotolerans]QUH22353.1 hypothetical protein HYG87_00520 [Methanobacterium alkalithermotolerans]
MVSGEKLIEKINEEIQDLNLGYEIFVKGKNGLNNIVFFDEPDLYPGEKSRFRIGNGSIMLFDGQKPILAIEVIPNKPTPPKDMAGPIPVYMVSRKIILNFNNGKGREYELLDKFPLIIVVPDQSETKRKQINDLNEKFKGIFNLKTEYSALNDFMICVDSDFSGIIKRMLD